jgi:hypothetical protein
VRSCPLLEERQRIHADPGASGTVDVPPPLLVVRHRPARVAVVRHECVEVDQGADLLRHPVGDRCDHGASIAVADQHDTLQWRDGEHSRGGVVDVTVERDHLRGGLRGLGVQAGERDRTSTVSVLAQGADQWGSYHQPPWQAPGTSTNVVTITPHLAHMSTAYPRQFGGCCPSAST